MDSTGALALDERARAPARDRRGNHRPGDGNGLRRPRLARHRGRDARPASSPAATPTSSRRSQKRITARYEASTSPRKVTESQGPKDGLHVTFEGDDAPPRRRSFDRVLVAVGRRANGDRSAPTPPASRSTSAASSPVDEQMRTNVEHIYAIGDVVGEPMLAHKATHEGEGGGRGDRRARRRPSTPAPSPRVAYTDPEVAWMGLTETEAKAARRRATRSAVFPGRPSGRALAIGRPEGLTKLLVDPATRRLLGAGIVGVERRRADRRGGLALEIGRRRRGHRADRPPAPDPVRDGRPSPPRRRRHDHRPVPQALREVGGAPGRSRRAHGATSPR